MTPAIEKLKKIASIKPDHDGDIYMTVNKDFTYLKYGESTSLKKDGIILVDFGNKDVLYGYYSEVGSDEVKKISLDTKYFCFVDFVEDDEKEDETYTVSFQNSNGQVIWLCIDDLGGKYCDFVGPDSMLNPYVFDQKPSLDEIMQWDRNPWFVSINKETVVFWKNGVRCLDKLI